LAIESPLKKLSALIESKRAKVGIFGAGYVGLPLACAFAEAGFETIACDNDNEKVLAIRKGHSYVEDSYVERSLRTLVESRKLKAEVDVVEVASAVDFSLISVPTPLTANGDPDLSYVTGVTKSIAQANQRGKFVILESSVYPGTTEEIVKPILEHDGLKAGVDFGLAFSPERVEFGHTEHSIRDIPKIVGGITPLCTQIACELYAQVIRARIVKVPDTRYGEAAKLLENTYRYVNIALVNELAVLHEKLGLDFFEVIAAASTKPFGFEPFYPGPGVGGHCIPKDPRYLSYKARRMGMQLRLVDLSKDINDGMVNHIADRLESFLQTERRTIRGSRIAVLGLAFKADVSDTRNSPSVTLANHLTRLGARISAYDPLVPSASTIAGPLVSTGDLDTAVKKAEVLILATAHTHFKEIDLRKLHSLMSNDPVIFDARGFWSPDECKAAGFRYLGLGRP
jgi:nucleotide sugar dehydrogenase